MSNKNPQINGNQLASALYGSKSVYQVRDSFGRKVLERETAEEVQNWLQKRPGRDFEIWILSGFSKELKQITTATEFLNNQINQL